MSRPAARGAASAPDAPPRYYPSGPPPVARPAPTGGPPNPMTSPAPPATAPAPPAFPPPAGDVCVLGTDGRLYGPFYTREAAIYWCRSRGIEAYSTYIMTMPPTEEM